MRKLKLFSVLFVLVLILCLPLHSIAASAESILNIKVSKTEDYLVTWSKVTDAKGYRILISDGYSQDYEADDRMEFTFGLYAREHEFSSGRYRISVTLNPGSGETTEYVDVEYVSSQERLGDIENIRFEKGLLKWDKVTAPEGKTVKYIVETYCTTDKGVDKKTFETKENQVEAFLFTGDGKQTYDIKITASVRNYQQSVREVELEYETKLAEINNFRIEGPWIIFDEVPGADQYQVSINTGRSSSLCSLKLTPENGVIRYALTDLISDSERERSAKASVSVRAVKYSGLRWAYYSKPSKAAGFSCEFENYPLKYKGCYITTLHDLNDILGDGSGIKYDPDSNKLTFKNVKIDQTDWINEYAMGVFYSDSDLTVAGSGEIRAYDTVFQLSKNLTFEAGSDLKLYSDRSVTITAKNVNVYSKYLTIESKGSTCIMSGDGVVYVGPSCGRFELNTAEGIPPFLLLDSSIVLDGARLLEPVNGEMDDFCVYLDGEVANHIVFGTLAATPTPTPIPTATATPKPTATSKPVPTATAAPTSVTKPTGKADPTAAPADPKVQICAFVERIYKFVLDREPEEEGAAFWTDELYAFRRTGAEVAQGFIFSPEFENRNTTNEEFVTILYKTFFGRDPEEEGMNFWLTQLKSGTMDRVTVANGFIYSQEWADTCASYGIRSGGDLKPAGKISPTELTYAFVERMYTTALGRSYDEEGKQYWAGELANFNVTGEFVGAAFFLSDEMNGYGLSDKDFLGRLYATFMNREADEGGAEYWLGVMASGTPRADIVFGFTRSAEFTEKCIEARILPY